MGEISIYEENLEIDTTFTKSSTPLPCAHNGLLVISNDYDEERCPYIGLIYRDNQYSYG